MMREYHVQFCERLMGKFRRSTHLLVIWNDTDVAKKYAIECGRLFNEAFPLKNNY